MLGRNNGPVIVDIKDFEACGSLGSVVCCVLLSKPNHVVPTIKVGTAPFGNVLGLAIAVLAD